MNARPFASTNLAGAAAVALSVLALATDAATQDSVRITEVLPDPVGTNSGRQIIEITNDRNLPVDLTGWHLSIGAVMLALPPVVLPPGQYSRIFPNAAGSTTVADIYLPTAPDLTPNDTVGLWSSGNPNDPNASIDFLSYGAGTALAGGAIAAGQWPSLFETIPTPSEGYSIAHFGIGAFLSQNEPSAFYLDGNPTLGFQNDPAMIFAANRGCPGVVFAPSLGLAREESRPWLGENFELDAYNLSPGGTHAVFVLGLAPTPPVFLDSIGMPGCALHVRVDATATVRIFGDTATLAMAIPLMPGLRGSTLYAQAFVPWSPAPNPIGAYMTNEVRAIFGWR
ncbi:MAG: lamin tail domain-containing protein [Planctomycetota bacterium]